MIARFSSGFKVVYKPKSLAVDVHFQELLTWLNDQGYHAPFRRLKILDRGAYGWVEFVPAHGCTSKEDVQRFYERQGGYLALLYALEAVDFHYENLIAAGEHPILVDLESLFHPRIEGTDTRVSDLGMLAGHTMAYSVLRVGLLPRRIWLNAESEGVDISGLGAMEGQFTPKGVPHWEGGGTDEMRFARKRVPIPGGRNRPTLNDTDINALDYAESIVAGFTSMYRLLLNHRDALLSDDGPLARFAEDEVRVIVRPTRTYGLLLQESFHPDVLRNALDRDRHFDRLWVGIKNRPYLEKAIPAEREDLQQGDIPMFTTRSSSRDVWGGSGERIADFFDEPGLALSQRRVQQLSEEDLEKQVWFIRASLATLTMGVGQEGWRTYRPTEPQTAADHDHLVAAARAVGDRLEVLALSDEQGVSWIGLALINERYWTLLPLGADLYSGLPGIALFLAYLGAVAQEEHYTALAQATLKTMRSLIERGRSLVTTIGFSGWGGLIYTLVHLGVLWDQPTLLAEAQEVVHLLPDLIERDEALDVIGGAAGCISSLISLYHCTLSDHALAAAVQCGDRLIACAHPMEQGIGWLTRIKAIKPLAGFSHGAAGMAWALLELFALTGEERFRTAALDAMAYERSLFSPEAGNWPDLRDFSILSQTMKDSEPSFMVAWCHGAPGIGLARLRALRHLDDAEIRAEIDTALKTTLAQGFGLNHSLCHGDLGNLELLLQASQTLDDSRWRSHVDHIAAMILESIEEYGWLCGTPKGVETPGLMTGLAGIGYGLLRLAEPARIPSVLVLAPPNL